MKECKLHTRLGMQPTQQDNTVGEGMDPKPRFGVQPLPPSISCALVFPSVK